MGKQIAAIAAEKKAAEKTIRRITALMLQTVSLA
jgi:hypothetical protein